MIDVAGAIGRFLANPPPEGRLRQALSSGNPQDAEEEWQLVEPVIARSEAAPRSPSRGGRPMVHEVGCRDMRPSEALDYVFGYTNANDVSSRDLQFSEGGQWTRSKSIDTFCPLGPFIATTDEIEDPLDLTIRCILNGEVMQDGTTQKMIFSVAELVSFLSQGMTLVPGDVILTGTPPGVGSARDPQVWLKAGDEVTIEIQGLGSLTNPVETD